MIPRPGTQLRAAQDCCCAPSTGRYGVSLAIAVLALAPYVVVTTAYLLYQEQIMRDLHASRVDLQIIAGIATAGYAFGALLGGDLTNRFRQRSLFLICEALFVIGSLLAALAGGFISYGAGRVLQGLATGLLPVIALPPVVRRFPPERMPLTAAWVNIGFFGAVALGPLLGGLVAGAHVWRWFYAGLSGIGAIVWAVSVATLPDQPATRSGGAHVVDLRRGGHTGGDARRQHLRDLHRAARAAPPSMSSAFGGRCGSRY